MERSFKKGVCKAAMTIACAAVVFTGALVVGGITAKAKTVKRYTIDFSKGQKYTYDDNEAQKKNVSMGNKFGYALVFIVDTYDRDFENKANPAVKQITSVLQDKPHQGIVTEYDDYYNALERVSFKADKGSVGTGRYVISSDVLIRAGVFNELDASINMCLLDTHFEESDYDNSVDYDDIEYIFDIKYSDDPIIVNNNVDKANTITFKTGEEIVKGGIKYRILNGGGDLCAVGLTKSKKKVKIPASVKFAGYNMYVTDIGKNFLKGNKKVEQVTIGAGVMNIGSKAFYQCSNLKTVKIKSKQITTIGKKAFGKNAKGFSIKMPKSCKKKYKKLLKKAK